MKIKSYPGYAIDASQEHSNKIEMLYKANWETTFKNLRIRSSQQNVVKEEEEELCDSSPQNYNDNRLFIQPPRDYGHQTLRIKNKPKSFGDWIDFDHESSTNVVNPLYNHTQNNWHSEDYLKNLPTHNSNKSNKIQRSQTVIVKQPTFSREVQNLKDPNMIKKTNTLWRSNTNSNNYNYNNNFTITSKRLDVSKTSKSDNDELYFTESCCDDESIGTSKQEKESYLKRSPYDKSASSKSYEESRHNTYNRNRMHCYETASTAEYVENLQKHCAENKSMTSKILFNPLAQNKNIQINRLDLVSINELSDLADYDVDGKSSSKSSGKLPKKEKRKGLSRMFYNTISAGSKLPKVFLNRSKTQRAALDMESYSNENTSDISSKSLSTTASSSLSATSSSKSSVGQNCDKFSIPRPRLITPVHTYTRKRRTGNLAKSQNYKDDPNNKNTQGKKRHIYSHSAISL